MTKLEFIPTNQITFSDFYLLHISVVFYFWGWRASCSFGILGSCFRVMRTAGVTFFGWLKNSSLAWVLWTRCKPPHPNGARFEDLQQDTSWSDVCCVCCGAYVARRCTWECTSTRDPLLSGKILLLSHWLLEPITLSSCSACTNKISNQSIQCQSPAWFTCYIA
jgi:hypothetical protein